MIKILEKLGVKIDKKDQGRTLSYKFFKIYAWKDLIEEQKLFLNEEVLAN
jgi:hypothetical protein